MSEAVLGTGAISYAPPRAVEAVGGREPGPVQPKERIQLLDVIRGFALFGILQVNWPDWSGLLGQLLTFFVDDKMRTIYSFLFGLGFAIQLTRAKERGRPFVARYAWRSILLLVIGSAHFVFIWDGDIVREYAIMSLTLLLISWWRPTFVLVFAIFALGFGLIPWQSLPGGNPNNAATAGTFFHRADLERAGALAIPQREQGEKVFVVRAQADHGDNGTGYLLSVRAHAQLLANEFTNINVYRFLGGQLLSLFLLGLWVGRKRILHEPDKHATMFRWILGVGLPLGFFANIYNAFGDDVAKHHIPVLSAISTDGIFGRVFYDVGNYVLALAYISGIALLVLNNARMRAWFAATLAPVGRMGLTNYLMQSVILTALLYGRGLGLQSPVNGWWRQLLLQGVFVVQILYSRWWFERFQFGPVEWAWRSLTWGKMQPLRIAQREVVTG
jgi:uncharacterized protein